MANILSFFLLYMLILGPNFKYVDTFYVFNFLCAFAFIFKVISCKTVPKFLIFNFIFTILFFIIASISIIINYSKSEDIVLLQFIAQYITFVLASLYICTRYERLYAENTINALVIHIYYILYITAVITIAVFLFPPFKELLLYVLDFKMATNLQVTSGIRSFDLSVGGGTALSILFVLGCILSFELRKNGVLSGYLTSMSPFIFLCSSLVTSRTGFLLSVIFIIYYSLLLFSSRFFSSRLTIWKAKELKYFMLSLLSFFSIIILLFHFYNELLFNVLFPWAFEFLFTKGFSTNSTDELLNEHYTLDFDSINLFFGGNLFSYPTDVGFLKMIYSGGFVLLTLFITWWTFYFIYIFINKPKNDDLNYFNNFNVARRSTLFFLLSCFIVNFKELIFFNSRGVFVLLIIFIIMCTGFVHRFARPPSLT